MFNAETILALEQNARSRGSEIQPTSLEGVWRLKQTWTRDGNRPSPGTDPLLRSLGAQFTFQAATMAGRSSTRWYWGPVRFEGPARLSGSRPLLVFHFHTVKLMLGGITLLNRSIPEPPRQRQPFFALIATTADGQWLTARGRGGGLALWMKSALPSQ